MKAMKPLPARALMLTFGLALSACNVQVDPGGNAALYTVSGNVLAPGVTAQGSGVVVQALTPSNWSAPHVAGQVLVQGSGEGLSAQSVAALSGVRTQTVSGTTLTLATTPAGQSDAAFAAKLSASGLKAQPNYLYQAQALPNDPGYPGNAGLKVSGVSYDQDYLTRINAAGGWNALTALGKTPVGALTAVLDTGVDATHEDLVGRLRVGANCASRTPQGECSVGAPEVTAGEVGHGTGISGMIGATTNNAKGLAGLTWSGQNLLPVRVFDNNGATTASLAAGLNYAVAQGARVINLSLGLIGTTDDAALKSAVNKAASRAVLVASAGNTPNDGLYYPASDPNVLAVGAVGNTDALACYSARPKAGQKAIDLLAPGGNAGGGTSICNQYGPDDLLVLTTTSLGRYRLDVGTSFAAPQVSGAASLILALRPELSAAQVRSILVGSAKPVSGGKLLDVGAAIKAASSFGGTVPTPDPDPTPAAHTYSVRVDATDDSSGQLVKTYTSSGSKATAIERVPYRLGNLPAGDYTLSATLTIDNAVSNGQLKLTVAEDTTQNIPTN